MKAVVLAGGFGTLMSGETALQPKPMIEIGGRPILWHILKSYSAHGVHDFIICTGSKGYVIKEYIANYVLHMSDVTFDLKGNGMQIHQHKAEPWRITLVDTGEHTLTGGRLKRVAKYLQDEDTFCFTYGDGLTDADLSKQLEYHRAHGKLATLLSVQSPGRFGAIDFREGDNVRLTEKSSGDGGWINAGYFILSREVLAEIEGDDTAWEAEPLASLADDAQLAAYKHSGFWQPMDTLRDKRLLDHLWTSGNAPWKTWS